MCNCTKGIVSDNDKAKLFEYIEKEINKKHPRASLIAVLHKAQELFGYLDKEVLEIISQKMNIPSAHIWGVATFYHYFNLKPKGQFVISVCMGTACYVKGANKILAKLKEVLKLEIGETSSDNMFTLQEARCLGACGLAPVVMVNDKIHGDLDTDDISVLIQNYKKQAKKIS